MTLQTSILATPGEVHGLIPAWDALSARDPRATPYSMGSLMVGLGDLEPSAGTPYIVTARCPNDELVGVLPLRRLQSDGRLGGYRLTGYTTWHTSYFDAIADPTIPEVGGALLEAVRNQSDWDRCDLSFLRPDGNLAHAMQDPSVSVISSSRQVDRSAYRFADVAGAVMAHKTARRLAKAGPVAFNPVVAIAELNPILADFARMHTARWEAFGDAAEFSGGANVTQLLRVMRHAVEAGHGRVGTLRLAGDVIAVHLAFRWQGAQYSWRMAHDAAWQTMSPGRLLMSLMIEEAFLAGCTRYDLGRGSEGYKSLWASEEQPLTRVTLYNRTWRARLAARRAQG